jgi:uncharacterized membrane protein YcaP (DUF421 family)
MRRNMHREFITEEELKSQLRKQGVEDVKKVKLAHMEADGHLSVIEYEKAQQKGKAKSGTESATTG